MADLTTGTTATTAQANEVAVGGVYVNSNVSQTDQGGEATLVERINNAALGSLTTFEGILVATGAINGDANFSIPPISYKWCGAICTYTVPAAGSAKPSGGMTLGIG